LETVVTLDCVGVGERPHRSKLLGTGVTMSSGGNEECDVLSVKTLGEKCFEQSTDESGGRCRSCLIGHDKNYLRPSPFDPRGGQP
jgi:hypothetical protein